MSRWFRFYDETLNDPKILKLSDRMHRIWIGILCVASKNNGKLPPLDDMALMIRMTPAKLDDAIKNLMIAGLIDQEGPILSPHNWDKRQFKSDVSNERVKRYRERKCNVTVTPPENRVQNTEKKDAAPAAPDPEVELFRRGREVLGKEAGGLIAKLLAAKQKNIALARAAIEQASTKDKPREYVGRIINGQKPGETAWLGGVEGII